MRICILSKDNIPLGFMDNELPEALHFYDEKLHIYLKGTAHTFEFTVRADHEDAELVEVGNKIAFFYKDRPYFLNIVNTEHDEVEIKAEAWAFALELLNETAKAYSGTSMTFEAYVKAMIYSSKDMLEIGINEVSDKKISNEWTGTTDTLLKRLYSLADVFDAELEFVPRLNADYSLDTIVMNVYKEHSDTVQGVGERRTDANFRYGEDITGITKTQDITNLYTCIRPTGSEDLTITGVEDRTYKNDDGEIEYFHKSGSGLIYAPLACLLFPSTVSGEDKYICYNWSTDYKDTESLFGNALAKLKELCIPESTYEIKGSIDVNIGDTITVIDESFTPKLYLETRVTEQEISFTDPTKNSTTFENTKELTSQIDDDLTKRVEELAKEQAATAQAAAEASTKAETATETANSAANKAAEANTAAASAETKATAASETATAANTAAAAATTTANAAKTTAETATETANTANATAEAAQTTANTANATANTAKTTAETAKAATDELNTLIRETDEGVEVAKIDTEGGYVGMRTEQTTDAYLIKDADGNTLASYGASNVEIGKNSTSANVKLCGGTTTISSTGTGANAKGVIKFPVGGGSLYESSGQASYTEIKMETGTLADDKEIVLTALGIGKGKAQLKIESSDGGTISLITTDTGIINLEGGMVNVPTITDTDYEQQAVNFETFKAYTKDFVYSEELNSYVTSEALEAKGYIDTAALDSYVETNEIVNQGDLDTYVTDKSLINQSTLAAYVSEALASALEWQLIGSATGTTSISFDMSKYKELFFCIITGKSASDKQTYFWSKVIPTVYGDIMPKSYIRLDFGVHDSTQNRAIVYAYTDKARIASAYLSNADVSAYTTLYVYGR